MTRFNILLSKVLSQEEHLLLAPKIPKSGNITRLSFILHLHHVAKRVWILLSKHPNPKLWALYKVLKAFCLVSIVYPIKTERM